jgi:hypothetical protein
MLPFTVTRPATRQEISIALDARDAKLAVGWELTNGNSYSVLPHPVPFQGRPSQNKP